MSTILVIEDDPDLQAVLEYNLSQEGHNVIQATTGNFGLQCAREGNPDLVLLDWMLPDMEGTHVCRALRWSPETESLPIIMLTARSEEVDRVVAFELGADDYVAKPFSMRELLLRVRAVLRRGRAKERPAATTAGFEFGCLRIDEGAHRLWVADQEVTLTQLEFKLLLTLARRRDHVHSRSSLLNKVWDVRADVTSRTVDTHVKRLREKLGVARDYIETVRGVGYRFVGTPPGDSEAPPSRESIPPFSESVCEDVS